MKPAQQKIDSKWNDFPRVPSVTDKKNKI